MASPVAPASSDAAGLGSGRAGALLAVLAIVFAALAAVATALPHDPYIRYQQLRQTLQFRSQWVYERIELDHTPIEIAIVGNSRMGAGVSAPRLQALLRNETGTNVHVANLSLPQEGRDIHYVVAKRLIEAHPELRTLVVSVVEEMPRTGHPAFRDLADASDVLTAPAFINLAYADNAATMPYRQMSLFVQTQAPALFGVHRGLGGDYLGPDFDTTRSFRLPRGHYVDRDSIVPPEILRAQAERELLSVRPQMLPDSMLDYEYAVERTYTRKLGDLARRRGVKIVFLQLPIYSDARGVARSEFYEAFGPILTADFLSGNPDLYSDYGHLNRYGSAQATEWLGQQLISLNLVGKAQ